MKQKRRHPDNGQPEQSARLLAAARRLGRYDAAAHLEDAAYAEEALRASRRPLPALLLDINAPDVLFAPALLHELARLRLLSRGVFADATTRREARADLEELADALALREPKRIGRPAVAPFEEAARGSVAASALALARIVRHAEKGGDGVEPAILDSPRETTSPKLRSAWHRVLPLIRLAPRFPTHLRAAVAALTRSAFETTAPARHRAAVHVARRWHELALTAQPITESALRAPLDGRLPWEAGAAATRRKSRLSSPRLKES